MKLVVVLGAVQMDGWEYYTSCLEICVLHCSVGNTGGVIVLVL